MGKEAVTSPLPGFEADTTVEDLGGGRFAATMSERWWVGKGPNGGYVAAVILKAIQASASAERAPRSLTVHFQRAPLVGPVEVRVEVEREGGRVTFLSARLEQEGKVQATAQAVLSEDWGEGGFSELTMPDAGEPGELQTIDPESRASRPNMLQNYRLRPALGEPAFSGGAPYTGAWIRSREPRLLDAPLAAAFLDTWFPAPFVRLERPVGAPTIDYTVHFRSPLPPTGATAEDPYLVAFRSGLARHGFFEEDGELWSADGTLLAQSRQLALLLDVS
jgi:acyl-CoA thioesterase